MLKKLAGSTVAAAALIAVAVIFPAPALAAPMTVGTGDLVRMHHLDGRADTSCTLGFVFGGKFESGAPDGQQHVALAGHCGAKGDEIQTLDGKPIGHIVVTTYDEKNQNTQDTALASLYDGVRVDSRIPDVGTASRLTSLADIHRTKPVLCKLGGTTALTCGPIVQRDDTPTPMVTFAARSEQGDSGSPVWTYGNDGQVLVVGTLSGGPTPDLTWVEPIEKHFQEWDLTLP